MTHKITLQRVFKTTPQRLYQAFINAQAWAKWLPPHGFYATVHSHNPVQGGMYHMSFTNLTTGKSHNFGGQYIQLIPNQTLVYTAVFDDPQLTTAMQTTVTHNTSRMWCTIRHYANRRT